jgi:hypothetical protein
MISGNQGLEGENRYELRRGEPWASIMISGTKAGRRKRKRGSPIRIREGIVDEMSERR